MKRIGRLWESIVSWENLLLAYQKARRGKRRRPSVSQFEFERERELLALQQELTSGIYRPGGYRLFTIYERKPRQIAAAPFRDRVVHHAVMNIVEPPLDRRFIHDSYACRKGKGVHAAVDRYQRHANRYSYVLKLDISKYFASIDHRELKAMLKARIKDARTLDLFDRIIDFSPETRGAGYLFPGDDLITLAEHRCGIPIGNLTSQFFANLYLDDFDHWLTEDRRVPGYIRYVDDLFLFADDKQDLWELQRSIESRLCELRLIVHPRKVQLRRTSERVDVLGYLLSRRRRWLRNENGYRARRRFKTLARRYARGELDWTNIKARLRSWMGHALHAETLGLRTVLLDALIFQRGRAIDVSPGVARRLVEQRTEEVAFRQPQQQRTC
jgi:RNA-directed DNA polymerase